MTGKFKKGDQVVCVDTFGVPNWPPVPLTEGRTYSVLSTTGRYVEIVDNTGTGTWDESRFERVPPPPAPPQVHRMSIDGSTVIALIQAHLKDRFNISDGEISGLNYGSDPVMGRGINDGVLTVHFRHPLEVES